MDKSIIILSPKCSGSSVLQRKLSSIEGVKTVNKTRHFQNETLFWTKAASVLGCLQIKLPDSEVPIPRDLARKDIIELLKDNTKDFVIPKDDINLIFEGWRRLVKDNGPVFLEKSPHHIFQKESLKLIKESIDRMDDVEVLIVGLLRDPRDVLYSYWRRWRIFPEEFEYYLTIAYDNLFEFKKVFGEKMILIKYEDFVNDPENAKKIFQFAGGDQSPLCGEKLFKTSIGKYSKNKTYGYVPSKSLIINSQKWGYFIERKPVRWNLLWQIVKRVLRIVYRMKLKIKKL